jgi:hypothetical protein
MCQKLSGSAFIAYGSVLHQDIHIIGRVNIQTFNATSGAQRKFCQCCGSTLFWQDEGDYGKRYLCVALGTLDSGFDPQDWQHYYTENKASWFAIQDGHIQHRTKP